MSVNKKTAGKGKAALKASSALSATRKALLAPVRRAAFSAGTSRNAVIAAVKAACGKRPVLALYNATKLELQIGYMAAALARKGDNREGDVLMEHCRTRLTSYAGFGGKQKLAKGQLGRRTKDEEQAYGSARVQSSAIFKEAGVSVAEKRGGDTSGTRKPRPAAKATKGKAEAATKPAVHRFKDKAAVLSYLNMQGAAMLATVNRSATATPIEAKTAVQDFVAALKKLG